MAKSGFVLSLEATLSLLIVASISILALSPAQKPDSLAELLILQKEHDLLKLWLKTRCSDADMIRQAKELFSGQEFELEINGIKVFTSYSGGSKTAISAEVFIVDEGLNMKKVKLTVFH